MFYTEYSPRREIIRHSATYLCHILSNYKKTSVLLHNHSKQLYQVIVPQLPDEGDKQSSQYVSIYVSKTRQNKCLISLRHDRSLCNKGLRCGVVFDALHSYFGPSVVSHHHIWIITSNELISEAAFIRPQTNSKTAMRQMTCSQKLNLNSFLTFMSITRRRTVHIWTSWHNLMVFTVMKWNLVVLRWGIFNIWGLNVFLGKILYTQMQHMMRHIFMLLWFLFHARN